MYLDAGSIGLPTSPRLERASKVQGKGLVAEEMVGWAFGGFRAS